MTHEDIQELLGAYALDATDAAEAAEVERHLASCDACSAEVAEYRNVAALLGQTSEPAPDDLWERVTAAIATDVQEHPDNVVPITTPWRWATSALAVAAIAASVVAVIQTDRISELRQQLERPAVEQAAVALAGQDGVQLVELVGDAGVATATLADDGTGILASHALPALSSQQTYQLWTVIDGEVISAGVLGSTPGTWVFHFDAERLDGLVITIEEAGGVAASEQPGAAVWFVEA